MWKLIIADDEYIIRQGLRKVIEWEKYDIEVVGEAEDGEVALEICEVLEPDIALIDICMPFLSGIELIQKLRNKQPNIKVIIISGHDEFDYAKKAVQLEVVDFLLKPVDEDELEQVIGKVVNTLKYQTSDNKEKKLRTKVVEKNIKVIKETYLQKLVEGFIAIDKEELAYYNLNYEKMSLIMIKPVNDVNLYEKNYNFDSELLFFSIQNIVNEILSKNMKGQTARLGDDYLIALVETDDEAICLNLINDITKSITDLLKRDSYIEYMVMVNGIIDIKKVNEHIKHKIKANFAYTPVVSRVKRFIEKNYGDCDLSLDDIADYVQMNPTYLSRLLKIEIGNSFIDFLTKVRIEKSKELIRLGTYKIYEIASMCGYKSQHYFSKTFKKVVGLSPKQYESKS